MAPQIDLWERAAAAQKLCNAIGREASIKEVEEAAANYADLFKNQGLRNRTFVADILESLGLGGVSREHLR